jgi:hypothetical protein
MSVLRLISALLIGLAPLLGGCAAQPHPTKQGLTSSVTYLNLLAKTPFFAELSREQLQWVIDHSQEWKAAKGAEITSSAEAPDNFFVLLDGGWAVVHDGKAHPAGHADPGKWYGGAAMARLKGDTRLVATADSFVMHIRQAELDDMVKRGFPVDRQLRDGLRYYESLLKD